MPIYTNATPVVVRDGYAVWLIIDVPDGMLCSGRAAAEWWLNRPSSRIPVFDTAIELFGGSDSNQAVAVRLDDLAPESMRPVDGQVTGGKVAVIETATKFTPNVPALAFSDLGYSVWRLTDLPDHTPCSCQAELGWWSDRTKHGPARPVPPMYWCWSSSRMVECLSPLGDDADLSNRYVAVRHIDLQSSFKPLMVPVSMRPDPDGQVALLGASGGEDVNRRRTPNHVREAWSAALRAKVKASDEETKCKDRYQVVVDLDDDY